MEEQYGSKFLLEQMIDIAKAMRLKASKTKEPLGAQNWIQSSRCSLTSAEERGRITSLDLLAILCLMQPRIPLALAARAHCWLMFNLVSTRTPRSFSARLLSSWVAPSIYWCLGLFLPKCRTWHFPWLNCMRFLSAHFSSLLRSLWVAARPSGISASPPSFGVISKLAEGTLCPSIHIINEDVEQDWI
ncbi:hypothetical protein QYF61_008754, partial [Mycteria americana]